MSLYFQNISTLKLMIHTRHEFLSSVNPRQEWPLPYFMICYITENPLTAKVYQKLIQSCKHFFIKNPIIVFEHLFLNPEENYAFLNHFGRPFNMENALCKLWMTDKFNCSVFALITPSYRTSLIIPQIFRCDAKVVRLSNQEISYNEFLFLSSNVEKIGLYYTPVKYEDGTNVPLEKLVKHVLNAKEICL